MVDAAINKLNLWIYRFTAYYNANINAKVVFMYIGRASKIKIFILNGISVARNIC